MKRKYSSDSIASGDLKRLKLSAPETTIDETKHDPLTRAVPSTLDNLNSIFFQLVDTDYYIGFPPQTSLDARDPRKARPIVRLYGITEEGYTVISHIIGFCSYFYVKAWEGFNPNLGHCELFRQSLENALMNDQSIKAKCDQYVPHVSCVSKQTLWGYHFGKQELFLKVYVTLPLLVPPSRTLLGAGIRLEGFGVRSFSSYESNLLFVLRFMIDAHIHGGGWVELPKEKYHIVSDNEKISRCAIETTISWNDVVGHNDDKWYKIAPLRILSFDIECIGKGFPEATNEHDQVIQIANAIINGDQEGDIEPHHKTVFCLNTCAPISGCDVRSFSNEKDMLQAWAEFVRQIDPDIITGYNVVNFDIPYLVDRAAYLKLTLFPFLGRIKNQHITIKESTFSSRAYGTTTNKDITIEGRIIMDLLPIIRRDYKLRSYSLNSVSFHFLKQQKEDVHYSIIGDLQNGDEQTRRRLAVYCLKDSILPLRLMQKLMILVNYVEMARVTGVPISYLITRGQQIKVLCQLYRKTQEKGLLIPYREHTPNEESFDGAIVIEPLKGYYQTPIATLDFASLYPSIMMAHNLCYTTMISSSDASKLNNNDYTITPTNNYFVKPHVQKGILPEILEELLAARKTAKKDMKMVTDPFKKAVLNGRQLALKISANSVYGFTGATAGSLPCLSISASVTGFGREMIDKTKKIIEAHYCIANGFTHDAQVIYGDTDSVMVKFGMDDMSLVMKLGDEAAKLVSKQFLNPIRLEFEKVYLPYLLMNKKRYAGMLWTNTDCYDYMDAKGIETVRRDNCQLVKTVVQKVLDYILIERDVHKAEEYTKGIISDLLQNKMDMSLLVITKALNKLQDYKVKAAHVELTERMKKRDEATAPKTGDRVQYVIVKGAKGARAYEKSEDPLFALENGIALDTDYYLEHQLKQPLLRIFEPILGDKINTLFIGDHTRTIKVSTSKVGAMMKFARTIKVCVGCKTVLKDNQSGVCEYCKPQESEFYMEKMAIVRKNESNYHRLWTQCQHCQGSLTQTVLCSNRDCPIFYRRVKARKDLEDARKILEQFSL